MYPPDPRFRGSTSSFTALRSRRRICSNTRRRTGPTGVPRWRSGHWRGATGEPSHRPNRRSGWALVTAGVRAPQPQLEVHHNGVLVAPVDLGYEDIKLALDNDGQWHADKDQLSRDRRRIRSLNAAGWYVNPITRDDLHNLDRLVETMRHLIESRERLL